MSSFRRTSSKNQEIASSNTQATTISRLIGVKSWINGLKIVSTGHQELNDILGGGLVLGTSFFIQNEHHSSYSSDIFSYILVDSISHSHPSLMILSSKEKIKQYFTVLPYNINMGISLEPRQSEELKRCDNVPILKIAYQYGKYFNKGKSLIYFRLTLIQLTMKKIRYL